MLLAAGQSVGQPLRAAGPFSIAPSVLDLSSTYSLDLIKSLKSILSPLNNYTLGLMFVPTSPSKTPKPKRVSHSVIIIVVTSGESTTTPLPADS